MNARKWSQSVIGFVVVGFSHQALMTYSTRLQLLSNVDPVASTAAVVLRTIRIIQNRLFDVGTVLARYNKLCSSEISQTHIGSYGYKKS